MGMCGDTALVGTIDVNDGVTFFKARLVPQQPTSTPAFREHLIDGEDRNFTRQKYERTVTHRLEVEVRATTTALLEAAILSVEQEALLGVDFTFSGGGSSITTSTRIHKLTRGSVSYIPDGYGRLRQRCVWDMQCDPGFESTAGTEFTDTVAPADAYTDLTDVDGDMDARTAIKVTSVNPCPFIAFGRQSGANYDRAPQQDYNDDATWPLALTGEAEKLTTMTGTYQTIGTPDDLDVNTYRGRYRDVFRVLQTDGTPADTTYIVESSVDGSGISDTQTYPTPDIEAETQNAYDHLISRPFSIPAVGIPSAFDDSGFGAVSDFISQALDDSTMAIAEAPAFNGEYFVSSDISIIEAVKVKLAITNFVSPGTIDILIYPYDTVTNSLGAFLDAGTLSISGDQVAAEGTISMAFLPTLPSGTYAFVAFKTGGFDAALSYKGATNPYADGTRISGTMGSPATEYANDDMYFKITGRTTLGFDANVNIQAKNSGGGDAFLDRSFLLPADEPYLIAHYPFAANEGPLADSLKVNRADSSGGVGGSIINRDATAFIERNKIYELAPGDNRIPVYAADDGATVPGNVTVSGTYWPKWKLPPGV